MTAAAPLGRFASLRPHPLRDWQAGIDQLRADAVPSGIPRETWERLVLVAGKFMSSRWPDQFVRMGWSEHDIFGCNLAAPNVRHDCKGLVWYLPGHAIEKAAAVTCLLRNGKTGTLQSFTRHAAPPHGQVLLWELPVGNIPR